jgi:hypothetical protein
MQRALIQYRNPKNRALVREALVAAHREDLIGFGPKCLVKPEKKGEGNRRRKGAGDKGADQRKRRRAGQTGHSKRSSSGEPHAKGTGRTDSRPKNAQKIQDAHRKKTDHASRRSGR